MANRDEVLETINRLILCVAEASHRMVEALPKVYSLLPYKGGFFDFLFFRRKNSVQILKKTNIELRAYLFALVVSMAERWPWLPPSIDFEQIEGGIMTLMNDRAIEPDNYLEEYLVYRDRFRTGQSTAGLEDIPDSEMRLHAEFVGRLLRVWGNPLLGVDQMRRESVLNVLLDETQGAEETIRKEMEKLWPVCSRI
ncbi:MAG: hypothetical protein HY207_06195 [Nitrospirae bacterium]|nr:hypothetical protein [Nitrospirota bacterium]